MVMSISYMKGANIMLGIKKIFDSRTKTEYDVISIHRNVDEEEDSYSIDVYSESIDYYVENIPLRTDLEGNSIMIGDIQAIERTDLYKDISEHKSVLDTYDAMRELFSNGGIPLVYGKVINRVAIV